MQRKAWFFGLFSLPLLYVLIAFYILNNGHLHEDAYILFQYVRNVNEFGVISFDKASGAAEGATDFLWMLMIASLGYFSIDLAYAAGILNVIGLFSILLFIFYLTEKRFSLFVALSVLVFFSGGVAASLGGFSSLAYGGIFSGIMWTVLEKRTSLLIALCLTLALFRPDGVLIAIGTFLSFSYFNRDCFGRIDFITLAAAIIIGIIYFFWRYNYFGLLLPLPLLVKSNTDQFLEGLRPNISALISYAPLFFITIRALIGDSVKRKQAIIFVSGPTLLFVFLIFSHQSQNVGNRFQFIIVLATIFLAALSKERLRLLLLIALAFPLVHGLKINYGNIKYLTNNDYINSFPQSLRKQGFNYENIAITEAGRLPYFYNADSMIDLVGLNSKSVVMKGAYKVLSEKVPDLIFVHHAGRYIIDGRYQHDSSVKFIGLSPKNISLTPYQGSNPVALAPEAALNFAVEKSYKAYIVRYPTADGDFNHVYFLRPGVDERSFLRAIDFAVRNKIPYVKSF